jgi:mannose-6-phosphate isomerase
MTAFLKFQPIYQERVWGGRELEHFLQRKLPGSAPVGESWEIVDRSEAQSVLANGPEAGKSLRELLASRGREILGPGWPAGRPFPILVKWLDCRERLSVQVHPPASIAARLGGEPKTENWYFARTDAEAAVYAGLRPGIDRSAFERAIADGTVDRCLERMAVRAGDSLLIRSGTLHAIDSGNVILEIQQNSDTTYRVYDWGRVGLDGKPRALHVRESLECLEASTAAAPRLLRGSGDGELARCPEFAIRRGVVPPGGRLAFPAGEQARILSVVDGELAGGGGALRRGDNVLLPYAGDFAFASERGATVLVTEEFSRP